MNIILYGVYDPENKVSKTLGTGKTLTGHLRESCSVISPEVNVAYFSGHKNYNYAYIEEFGRYYYIRDMVFDSNFIQLKLEVDVLMSFSSEIRTSTGTATRAQYAHYQPEIIDEMVAKTPRVVMEAREFGTAIPTVSGGNYILMTSLGASGGDS